MIGLSSPTADTSGDIILNEDKGRTRIDEPSARISRSKCLDGTSYINHSGVVDGDRTFTVVIPNVTESEYTIIKRLHRNYTSLTVACREGVFKGTMAQPKVSGGVATVKILIEESYTTA